MSLFIEPEIVDPSRRRAAIDCVRRVGVKLPTWSELADPETIDAARVPPLGQVDPDAPDGANLWRVHWFNAADRKSLAKNPGYWYCRPSLPALARRSWSCSAAGFR